MLGCSVPQRLWIGTEVRTESPPLCRELERAPIAEDDAEDTRVTRILELVRCLLVEAASSVELAMLVFEEREVPAEVRRQAWLVRLGEQCDRLAIAIRRFMHAPLVVCGCAEVSVAASLGDGVVGIRERSECTFVAVRCRIELA